MSSKTEVLIIKNPMRYKHLAPKAFDALIGDGRWIPLVFGAVEKVVNEHFFELCELDWDYLREASDEIQKNYVNYKSLYHKGLNETQKKFVQQVADEIEEEIRFAAEDVLNSIQNSEEE